MISVDRGPTADIDLERCSGAHALSAVSVPVLMELMKRGQLQFNGLVMVGAHGEVRLLRHPICMITAAGRSIFAQKKRQRTLGWCGAVVACVADVAGRPGWPGARQAPARDDDITAHYQPPPLIIQALG